MNIASIAQGMGMYYDARRLYQSKHLQQAKQLFGGAATLFTEGRLGGNLAVNLKIATVSKFLTAGILTPLT